MQNTGGHFLCTCMVLLHVANKLKKHKVVYFQQLSYNIIVLYDYAKLPGVILSELVSAHGSGTVKTLSCFLSAAELQYNCRE